MFLSPHTLGIVIISKPCFLLFFFQPIPMDGQSDFRFLYHTPSHLRAYLSASSSAWSSRSLFPYIQLLFIHHFLPSFFILNLFLLSSDYVLKASYTLMIKTDIIYVFAEILVYQEQQTNIEQSFGLCGRGSGWDDLGEWH